MIARRRHHFALVSMHESRGQLAVLHLGMLADLPGLSGMSGDYAVDTVRSLRRDVHDQEVTRLARTLRDTVHDFLVRRGLVEWTTERLMSASETLALRGPRPGQRVQHVPASVALDGASPRVTDGILAIDALLADLLDELESSKGATIRASELGDSPDRIWRRWGGVPPCVAGQLIAEALLERERKRAATKHPAIVLAVHDDVLAPLFGRDLVVTGARVTAPPDTQVATIDPLKRELVEAIALTTRGLAKWGGVLAHRLVNLLVRRAFEADLAGVRSPGIVEFSGGWSGVAAALGWKSKDLTNLKAIAAAGQHLAWKVRGWTGGLWLVNERPETRGRAAVIEFSLGRALRPGYATEQRVARNPNPDASRLVPYWLHEPPIDAVREHDQGAVLNLARLFMRELADRSRELAEHGSIGVKPARWMRLAADAGLPASSLDSVLASWRKGSDEAPPFIAEVAPGRFRLAPEHELAGRFLEHGGEKRTKASERRRRGRS